MITTVIADGKKEYDFIELLKSRAQNSDKNVIPIVSEIIENVKKSGKKFMSSEANAYAAVKSDITTPLNLTAKHLKRQRFLLMKSTL